MLKVTVTNFVYEVLCCNLTYKFVRVVRIGKVWESFYATFKLLQPLIWSLGCNLDCDSKFALTIDCQNSTLMPQRRKRMFVWLSSVILAVAIPIPVHESLTTKPLLFPPIPFGCCFDLTLMHIQRHLIASNSFVTLYIGDLFNLLG